MRIKVSMPFTDQADSAVMEIELEAETIFQIDDLIKRVQPIKEKM